MPVSIQHTSETWMTQKSSCRSVDFLKQAGKRKKGESLLNSLSFFKYSINLQAEKTIKNIDSIKLLRRKITASGSLKAANFLPVTLYLY